MARLKGALDLKYLAPPFTVPEGCLDDILPKNETVRSLPIIRNNKSSASTSCTMTSSTTMTACEYTGAVDPNSGLPAGKGRMTYNDGETYEGKNP